MRLHCVERVKDDRLQSAFAAGRSRWILEAVKQNGSDLWEGRDFVSHDHAADRKIWSTIYTRIATSWQRPRPALRSIAEISANLARLLRDIAAFSDDAGIGHFAKIYRDALAVLEGGTFEPSIPDDDFVVFAKLAPDAARLYQATLRAWNFGGMGSWNDYSFDGELGVRYQRLSQDLFERLREALTTVANTTFRSN